MPLAATLLWSVPHRTRWYWVVLCSRLPEKGVVVWSLFDGIGCLLLALLERGITVRIPTYPLPLTRSHLRVPTSHLCTIEL
jgi:hypothetical protein